MIRAIPTYWYRSDNFGDKLGPYLVEKISGLKPVYVNPGEGVEHIAVIGSIMEVCRPDSHVWGLGTAHEDAVSYLDKSKVYALRGELTKKICGIETDIALGDPALLLPRFINPPHEKKYKIGIIPHVCDLMQVYKNYANRYKDYRIINLADPIEKVVTEILECEMTISSALHGMIASHAYGIRCRWVEFSDGVIGNGFKFRDYFTTVETEESPIDLRSFPDISGISIQIPEHKIIVDLDKLMESCPIL